MTSKLPGVNVDLSEIRKFSSMAAEWWDPAGKFKALHMINPLRLQYILDKIPNLAGKKVLDIGCGGGILSESLARQGAQVVGLDCAEKSLQIAKIHARQENLSISYYLESAEEHVKKHADQYDIITCMELLEHVPSPSSVINSCAALLVPKGTLFLSTINRNTKSRLFLIVGAEYITHMLPVGTHNFNKFIRPSELMQWLEQNQFTTNEFKGMEYRLFEKNHFILSDNVDVNYLTYATKKQAD